MSDLKTIENVVKSFVKTEVSFTSVDIANEIKKMGLWIRNREIAQTLRSIYSSVMIDYEVSEIEVKRAEDDEKVIATLYHHKSKKPESYLNTEAKPLTPNNFLKSEKPKQKYDFLDLIEKKELFEKNKKQQVVVIKSDKDKDKDKDESSTKKTNPIKKGFVKSERNYTTFNFL